MDLDIVRAGVALVKRTVGEDAPTNLVLPWWAILILFVEFIVFLPAVVYINYTMNLVFPMLAMIEDSSPPAYEPVSLSESADPAPIDDEEGDDDLANQGRATGGDVAAPQPVTSSLRQTLRLMSTLGFWSGHFRGLIARGLLVVATGLISGLVLGVLRFVPGFVARLIASLALVQISTAWVHTVIAAPPRVPAEGDPAAPAGAARPSNWFRSLPPIRRTFEATCFPVLIDFVAVLLSRDLPLYLSGLLGLPAWDPTKPREMPVADDPASAAWKAPLVILLSLALHLLLAIPAKVLLVRVQASLLPPEDDAIVAFDRSFGGRVEPALVGGKGYVSMRDALVTFPRSAWVRLYVLYAKVMGVSALFAAVVMAVLVPELMLFSTKST